MVLVNTLILQNQQVVEEKMMEYRTREMALNIEMISDYQNPGYLQIKLPVNYTMHFERHAGETNLTMTIKEAKQSHRTRVHAELEPQSYGTIEDDEFCILEDLPEYNFYSSFPPWMMGSSDGDLDVEDTVSGYETGGATPEGGDQYVQVFKGECPDV